MNNNILHEGDRIRLKPNSLALQDYPKPNVLCSVVDVLPKELTSDIRITWQEDHRAFIMMVDSTKFELVEKGRRIDPPPINWTIDKSSIIVIRGSEKV